MLNLKSANRVASPSNLLPFDGELYYYGTVTDEQCAAALYEQLLSEIKWKHDESVIFGKKFITKRKYAWFGDEPYRYKYSNTTKVASIWIPELLPVKALVELMTGETFNSCLLNLYHNGEEGLAWHSDSERELKENGAIASMSFGAVRKFAFKHKETGQKIELMLEHGSLLVMKGSIQTHWLHSLPKSKKVKNQRINLTFRMVNP